MKNKALAVSLVGNVALAGLFLWTRADHQREYDELARAAMRSDEIHVKLHAKSLAALEDAVDVPATEDILRQIIAVGEDNIAAREKAGCGR